MLCTSTSWAFHPVVPSCLHSAEDAWCWFNAVQGGGGGGGTGGGGVAGGDGNQVRALSIRPSRLVVVPFLPLSALSANWAPALLQSIERVGVNTSSLPCQLALTLAGQDASP